MAYHRDDPESAPWTLIDENPTPGSGVEPQDATFSGMVISEVNDAAGAGNYIYEYVELYYDGGGWQILQFNSSQSYTIPAGTMISPGDYVIVARDAPQAAFEAFYGVSLGSNVTYLNSAGSIPQINGDEVYELRNAGGGLEDGPTPPITTIHMAYHRNDPESAPWTLIDESPTPGSGVEPQDATFSGMVISEVNDAPAGPGNYIYEYVELYFDGPSPVGVSDDSLVRLGLGLRAWPNPFNPLTTIQYDLPEPHRVALHIYDVSGRLVRVLRSAVYEETGKHEAIWYGKDDSGRPLASGTYLYHLQAGNHVETKRMTLIR
jgi:hypothetical protein